MLRGPLLVAVMLGAALAGCLQSPTPSADADAAADVVDVPDDVLHSIKEILPVQIRAQDGTPLRGHVFLPDAEEPHAVVLELSPYWNTAYGRSEDWTQEDNGRLTAFGWLAPFLDAGFAVALINMRGTGPSEGCFQFGSPVDTRDAYDVVEWLAAQPWSNGNVGMTGHSYPGWSQFLAIAGAPPSLKAAVASSGVIDLWALLTRYGAPLSIGPAVSPAWTLGTGLGLLAPLGVTVNGPFVPDTHPSHAACPRYGPDFAANLQLAWDGGRTPYFDERDLRPLIEGTEVAVFVTNGMTSGEGHILQFEGLWDLLGEDRRMLIGQWAHAYPTSQRPEFRDMAVAWFDHYLRDGPMVIEPGIVEYQDDARQWHATPHWPPAAATVPVFLSGDRIVGTSDEVRPGQQVLLSAYVDPHPRQCGNHQALFVSPPLAEDLHLAGNFHVNITLTSTLPDGHIAAYLYKTAGPGLCPDEDAREIRRALSTLRHWDDETGRDFPINVPTAVNLTSHPFASHVPAGHRLVLAIGGDSTELLASPRKPVLTVSTGPGLAGVIVIPVVAGNVSFVS